MWRLISDSHMNLPLRSEAPPRCHLGQPEFTRSYGIIPTADTPSSNICSLYLLGGFLQHLGELAEPLIGSVETVGIHAHRATLRHYRPQLSLTAGGSPRGELPHSLSRHPVPTAPPAHSFGLPHFGVHCPSSSLKHLISPPSSCVRGLLVGNTGLLVSYVHLPDQEAQEFKRRMLSEGSRRKAEWDVTQLAPEASPPYTENRNLGRGGRCSLSVYLRTCTEI